MYLVLKPVFQPVPKYFPVLCGCLTCLVVTALACQVPVFRYALERWRPDPYLLRLVTADPSDSGEALQAAIDLIEKNGFDGEMLANISLEVLSPTEATKIGLKSLDNLPQFSLHYPHYSGTDISVWQAPATKAYARSLLDSPLRRELRKQILAGTSATWILLESGNKTKDAKAAADLKRYLNIVSQEIELPEGVVGANEQAPRDPNFDPANQLDSDIPLHIDFNMIRLSRTNAQEQVLLAMLTHLEPDLNTDYKNEPMAFPVFGRGRVLPPYIGEGITEDLIWDACAYICGACSCEVKSQNPGEDLLMMVDWDGAMDGREILVEKVLPPLEGIGSLIRPPLRELVTNAVAVEVEAVTNSSAEAPAATPPLTQAVTSVPPLKSIPSPKSAKMSSTHRAGSTVAEKAQKLSISFVWLALVGLVGVLGIYTFLVLRKT